METHHTCHEAYLGTIDHRQYPGRFEDRVQSRHPFRTIARLRSICQKMMSVQRTSVVLHLLHLLHPRHLVVVVVR